MTDNECCCPQCLHPSCPLPNAEPPYDEISHEIDNNILSVKIPKTAQQILSEQSRQVPQNDLDFDFNCADEEGEKCRTGCNRVHVILDQQPPTKKPEEEILSLRAIRQIMANDDLRNTLEIEFKAPRNYIPLPEPGPPPPIIVPKQKKIRSRRKKRKSSRKK